MWASVFRCSPSEDACLERALLFNNSSPRLRLTLLPLLLNLLLGEHVEPLVFNCSSLNLPSFFTTEQPLLLSLPLSYYYLCNRVSGGVKPRAEGTWNSTLLLIFFSNATLLLTLLLDYFRRGQAKSRGNWVSCARAP
jgi:hypothetical protein